MLREILLRMPNRLLKYFLENRITGSVTLFLIFSIVLKSTTGIDLLIPCLWKTLFGVNCPGCGLTTALVNLLHFEFATAYALNKLAFVVFPLTFFCFLMDFRQLRVPKLLN